MHSSVAVLRATIASMQENSHASNELLHQAKQLYLDDMPELQSFSLRPRDGKR